MYAINHCQMRDQIKRDGLDEFDFQEAVMTRAGQIVGGSFNGKGPGTRHALPGVELVALAVANSVIDAGAAKLATDFNVDLGELKKQAAAQHVSYC